MGPRIFFPSSVHCFFIPSAAEGGADMYRVLRVLAAVIIALLKWTCGMEDEVVFDDVKALEGVRRVASAKRNERYFLVSC